MRVVREILKEDRTGQHMCMYSTTVCSNAVVIRQVPLDYMLYLYSIHKLISLSIHTYDITYCKVYGNRKDGKSDQARVRWRLDYAFGHLLVSE